MVDEFGGIAEAEFFPDAVAVCVDCFDDIGEVNSCLQPLYALPRIEIHQRYPLWRQKKIKK